MKKQLPSPETLRQLLRYEPDTGKLFWRERGPEWFTKGRRPATASAACWNAARCGKEALTTVNQDGYLRGRITADGLQGSFMAHRVIWSMMTGREPRYEVDHINGNPADNRWANLRDVKPEINAKNTAMKRNNTSGATGVYFKKASGKWGAVCRINGRQKHLGYFVDIKDAIKAREDAIKGIAGFTERHGKRKGRE